ncbi:hypothetical protein LTR36_008410 [Oleoguttula mirabilis]|uniref:Uncharacterized protein n=1 Tax=Oleoguttula mirabilis TaxID=1507867 RepID=A0AAV9J7I5_9PEZI|nr:hypothetical protein LTR36_008410 [Oleoguttula mirabilis]
MVSTGSSFVFVALVIYALYRRRKGATVKEIIHFRRHDPSVIMLSPTRQKDQLTALPIYREERYSVRSSMHPSMLSTPRSLSHDTRAGPVPPRAAQRFHAQNPYVKHVWKTADPSPRPKTPTKAGRSFLVDASPPPQHLSEPDQARLAMSRQSAQSRMTEQSRGETKKAGLSISVREQAATDVDAATPPDTPNSQQDAKDRWSWTNSQAPTTPRMYAHSMRSSISSLPRFRSIRSWVRGQGERIVEEERPITSQATKMAVLRNKASYPTLAPPATKTSSKLHTGPGRVDGLLLTSRKPPGAKTKAPMSPHMEEQRLDAAPEIEISEASR